MLSNRTAVPRWIGGGRERPFSCGLSRHPGNGEAFRLAIAGIPECFPRGRRTDHARGALRISDVVIVDATGDGIRGGTDSKVRGANDDLRDGPQQQRVGLVGRMLGRLGQLVDVVVQRGAVGAADGRLLARC
jgi:hypothetical protein